ncbi:uncharacterized protein VP01_550g4 [Puccinia sorghi]|uniref:CCHC-type domain-containing protein n=1 Tax=Puccinia sorghi TaxID=27349 RepID=A0A0L6ULE2_9BASI|nr:uncharacterized protein VP01_550g4 [Puccinia sorghi]
MSTNNTNPPETNPDDTTDISPRAKFLSKPTKYKDSESFQCVPSAEDFFAEVGNIKRGNQPPPPHLLARNNSCTYCSGTGHWCLNCPVL